MPQLKSDLCDFNDAYIAVTGNITATNAQFPEHDDHDDLALKNFAPFLNCTLKINNHLIEDAQDLGIVNPIYNLHNFSKSFRKITGSFWNYYPDMPDSNYVGNNERTRVFYSIRNSESFNYKTKLVGNLPAGNNVELENIKFVAPLKNLSSFIFN